MYLNMQSFVNIITDDVRYNAHQNLNLTQGAIGVAIVPQCKEAMEWAGVDRPDVMLSFIAPMWASHDTLVDDLGTITGDAAGIVMMKIASAKVAMTKMKADGIEPKTHEGYSSGNLPEQAIGKQGLTKEKGGIAFPILRHNFETGKKDPYMTVYVAVDGASDEFTDDAAAWFGINPISHGIFMEDELCIPTFCTI